MTATLAQQDRFAIGGDGLALRQEERPAPHRRAGIDANRVVDSVRHRAVAVTGHPGELAATDAVYRATGMRPAITTGNGGNSATAHDRNTDIFFATIAPK